MRRTDHFTLRWRRASTALVALLAVGMLGVLGYSQDPGASALLYGTVGATSDQVIEHMISPGGSLDRIVSGEASEAELNAFFGGTTLGDWLALFGYQVFSDSLFVRAYDQALVADAANAGQDTYFWSEPIEDGLFLSALGIALRAGDTYVYASRIVDSEDAVGIPEGSNAGAEYSLMIRDLGPSTLDALHRAVREMERNPTLSKSLAESGASLAEHLLDLAGGLVGSGWSVTAVRYNFDAATSSDEGQPLVTIFPNAAGTRRSSASVTVRKGSLIVEMFGLF